MRIYVVLPTHFAKSSDYTEGKQCQHEKLKADGNGVSLEKSTRQRKKQTPKAERFTHLVIRRRNVARNSFLDSDEFQIAREKIPNARHLYKFGYNPALVNSYETIWDGSNVYTYPSSAAVLALTSTSDSDAAKTVRVIGLDQDWVEREETVTLHASTPSTVAVNTTTTFIRVYRMYNNGSSSYVGDIQAKIGATVHAQITAGNGQTLMAVYTVPAGKTLYLTRGSISHGSDDKTAFLTGKLLVRSFGGVFRTQNIQNLNNIFLDFDWEVPLKISAKSDIECRAVCSKNQANAVSATFEGILIDGA